MTIGIAVLVVLAAALGWAPNAQAQGGTQCSASMTLIPSISPPTALQQPPGPNDIVTLQVFVSQTCTTGGAPVSAALTGTTKIDVACATANNLGDASGTGCDVANEQLGSLAVTNCTATQPNSSCAFLGSVASITYGDSCVPPLGSGTNCLILPFGNLVQVATITAQTVAGQQIVPAPGEFFITGSTGGSNVDSGSAQASAQGSAPENYPFPTPTFTVAKTCAATFNQATQQVNVSFTATVTNQDVTEAINYDCTDSTGAALSNNPGQAPIAPGTATVTGSYTQAGLHASDTITCTATGASSGNAAGTQTANADCTAVTNPSINVVKGSAAGPGVCVSTFNQANQNFDITFTATLTNNGNETLNNVTCSDVPNATLSAIPSTLTPGQVVIITGSYSTGSNPASDTITCSGIGATSLTQVTSNSPATCQTTVTPAISVLKGSANGPNTCVSTFNQPNQNFDVTFSFTVTNTGPETLNNVTCSDNPAATLVGTPTTLTPGQSAVVTGSYSTASNPAHDTITCNGVGAVSGTPVSANSPATCQATVTPTATLTKACTATINAAGTGINVSFTATLTNTGPENLNVTGCTDNPPASLTGVPSTLAHSGGTATITGNYTQTSPSAADTLTCNATGAVSGTGISPAGSAACPVTPRPAISVVKGSASGPNTCVINFNPGTQQFDVTFSFTLTNTGNEQLNNVTCSDNPAATLSAVPTSLSPGQSAVVTGSYSQAGSIANDTITCNGVGAISGTQVTTNSPATCTGTPPQAAIGCRITAGGITPNGQIDPGKFADATEATFGGQVGAPCGCIGAFDSFDNIQGNWTDMRKSPGVGSFHAKGFNSLVCGCDPTPGDSDGVFGDLTGLLTGQLCNPNDRGPGPFPPNAPANLACFTGVGGFNPTSGPRTVDVAFRVEVEDRSQPGAGKNSGPSPSAYRIRIWIPSDTETAEGLAELVACTGPLSNDFCPQTIRDPDIDDGGGLIHGAIQIHKQIPKHVDICPVPDQTCPQPLTCPE